MTQFTPYYFDGDLVSANLSRGGRFNDDAEFALEVDVNDDDLKGRISPILADYEEELDR